MFKKNKNKLVMKPSGSCDSNKLLNHKSFSTIEEISEFRRGLNSAYKKIFYKKNQLLKHLYKV